MAFTKPQSNNKNTRPSAPPPQPPAEYVNITNNGNNPNPNPNQNPNPNPISSHDSQVIYENLHPIIKPKPDLPKKPVIEPVTSKNQAFLDKIASL